MEQMHSDSNSNSNMKATIIFSTKQNEDPNTYKSKIEYPYYVPSNNNSKINRLQN